MTYSVLVQLFIKVHPIGSSLSPIYVQQAIPTPYQNQALLFSSAIDADFFPVILYFEHHKYNVDHVEWDTVENSLKTLRQNLTENAIKIVQILKTGYTPVMDKAHD